ncbi:toll-like receptor 6 [Hermetia illucens]|uniref:toll-like receptor 6 n=1 Tax=Hermetia illucens TaxID=343691 RepID=UPI0018CC3257|nr:toll-like receptor 6 [Hermetia illucens]XP_037923310.1 toll-like receptor 6 [Hermetia illucens]XP_037923318.1 toll-like receptor 6 [Hermetia illucens]
MTLSNRRTASFPLWSVITLITQFAVAQAVNCPNQCNCDWVLDSLSVNCSSRDLINLPDFSDLPIETLYLSNNKFTEFPTELSLVPTLTSLDLSNNFIHALSADTFLGFKNLRHLYLRGNNITKWADINPARVLMNTVHLETLSLAGNPISTFSTNDQRIALISTSLLTLDLSFCNITKITGNFALQGMNRLENLILAGNPLQTITRLESLSLKAINLSSCELHFLPPNIFSGVPNLQALDLSRNSLLTLEPQANGYVTSRSLRRINLSYCNMPSINLEGFPNVTTVLLKGNMIREISETSFRLNSQIENLDLSNNAIRLLEPNAFSNLRILKRLDLSYNMIGEVDRSVFSNNEILTNLNLSRNYLTRFGRIIGTSILNLDLSSCEITSIAADSLIHMPVTDLNLSNNLISSLPAGFASQTLQTLDLGLNRLSSITNTTFRHFPELSALILTGNRFTVPFKPDYFKRNQYLHFISLEDNPWRCDCKEPSFKQFFLYLTQSPPKITSTKKLKCTSPEQTFGRTWDAVCFSVWFPQQNMSTIEKFWAIAMSSLAALCLSLFAYRMAKKYMKKKKQRRNTAELRENLEEQRRLQNYNRQFIEQEAQQNAPDPRESNPPSYEAALLMPPLKRLTKSYADITMKESNEGIDQPDSQLQREHRSRFHSDNALLRGDGDDERVAKIRRTPSFRRHAPRSRRGSRLVAVRPPRCPDGKFQNSESLGKMSNFVSFENSPYTRRKPRSTTASSVSPSSSAERINDEGPSAAPLRNNSLDFIENYYVRPKSISNSGDDYEIVSSHSDPGSRRTSVRSSVASDLGIVIVHNKPPSEGPPAPNDATAKASSEPKEPKESQF